MFEDYPIQVSKQHHELILDSTKDLVVFDTRTKHYDAFPQDKIRGLSCEECGGYPLTIMCTTNGQLRNITCRKCCYVFYPSV